MPYPFDSAGIQTSSTTHPASGHLVLDEAADMATITYLVTKIPDGYSFTFYDRLHPSPSDPGAYVSFCRAGTGLKMSSGNHGWSTAAREVTTNELIAYFWRCREFNLGRTADEMMWCQQVPAG